MYNVLYIRVCMSVDLHTSFMCSFLIIMGECSWPAQLMDGNSSASRRFIFPIDASFIILIIFNILFFFSTEYMYMLVP